MNLSKPVSMELIDRIEWAIQFIECTNTVDLLREAVEEIETLRASLSELLAMCNRQVDFNDDRDGLTLDRARAVLGGDE